MAEPKMPEKLGRYEVVRELGKGAMGVVYEGKDPNIGRRVAIKTARREVVEASGMADEMMERFLREAQAAGALNHPNIITIYDAAEEEGIAYIAMEYLEGGDLNDVIERKQKLDMETIVEIGAGMCEALHVAHASGVVHRDIKPANILLPEGQPLKVADFGIAHVSDSNLTQDGALIGTPHYMSPEQFMGQKVDGRSDLFSVGNILYELTTGEKPFTGEQLSTVMHHVIKTDPVNPVELNFNVPDALAQVILKALNKRPAQRYKTGNEMAAALRESLKEYPDPAIIDPSSAVAMEATVAGTPPADADATVAGGPPPTDADANTVGAAPPNEDLVETVPGTRASSQETTISDQGPGATAPGGSPASGATIPGGAPPETREQPATAGAPATAPGPGANRLVLLASGVIVVLILALVGIFSLGGDEEPADGGDPSLNAATSNPQPEVTLPDAYYSTIIFNIFRAKTEDAYRKYVRENASLDQLAGEVEDVVGPFTIELLDGDEAVVASFEYMDSGDLVDIPLENRATVPVEYHAHIPSPENPAESILKTGEVPEPDGPGATATIEVVVAPAGV